MKKEFKMVAGWVMSVLGIQNFAKDDNGKLFLTAEQEQTLKEKYGEKFVEGFKADLAKMEVNGDTVDLTLSAEEKLELEAGRLETANMKKRIEALEAEKLQFQATIATLEKQAANSEGKKVELSDFEKNLQKAGVDLSLKHNRFLADYLQGKVQAAYSGDSTIDTQELKKEFGKYVDSNRLEILKGLFGQTESTKYMSTIVTDKVEVRANQASIIGTVLQQFVPEWTPSGAAKFTPLVIRNFKCKMNVRIKPSDIMEDILGYMYDEQASTLQSMPIVRYILWQQVFPKLDEERENALALGRFKENTPDNQGKYAASTPMETMDGYLTQLIDKYNDDAAAAADDPKSNIRWIGKGMDVYDCMGENAHSSMMEMIDAIVDEIANKYPLYARKQMFVHADPNIILEYQRDYRAHYPTLKNEDGDQRTKIDFSKFTFAPLEGMRGTGCFFITPKENFKHLMSHNPQNVTLRFQEQDYDVKIFGEWWEGTGFWLAEALFAYIAPAAAVKYKKSTTAAAGAGEGQQQGDGAGL